MRYPGRDDDPAVPTLPKSTFVAFPGPYSRTPRSTEIQVSHLKPIRIIPVLIAGAFAIWPAALPAAAQVEGRITRVGLFAGGDPIVRTGNWSFVEVELRHRGTSPFGGQLRVSSRDRDGDVVNSILPVALEPGGDWRPYQLYFVPYHTDTEIKVSLFNDEDELVRVYDDTGQEVAELTGPTVSELRSDHLLIVDLSSPIKLPHLTLLDMYRRSQRDRINPRRVRAMAPRELPSRWQGLEAVDVIVWDDADPSTLSPLQTQALMDWVDSGGRLLISGGKNWRLLADSPLAETLPVRIVGAEERTEAQEFLDIVEDSTYSGRLNRHYARNAFMRCLMTPKPDSVPMPTHCPNPQICHRRMVGRGMVIFIGASLKQLLPAPKRLSVPPEDGAPFSDDEIKDDLFVSVACEQVIARRLLALPPVREERSSHFMSPPDLFQSVRSSISFESVGTKFLLFAIVFAAAYTFVATLGSFWYLRRRGWLHHCWTAFGAVAIAGSVVGTGMVGMLRGITKSLWQTSVIDGRAGEDAAYGVCLFGVKTPNHTQLDIRLPIGEAVPGPDQRYGMIQPMPGTESMDLADSRFAAAASYEMLLSGERMENVPVRATLKEFQGYWQGPLSGTLEGKLVLRRPVDADSTLRYEFGPGSFLRNQLGADLVDCYLLVTTEEVAGERLNVLANCFYLGDLPAEGAGSDLSDLQLRHRLLYTPKEGVPFGDPSTRLRTLPRLSDKIEEWSRSLQSVIPLTGQFQGTHTRLSSNDEYTAILMLSTFDLIRDDPNTRSSFRRGHGRRLGCTYRLTPRTALLIGRTDAPPPAVLEVNQRPLRPSRSNTIYRFVIPVEPLERPQGPDTDDAL